MNIKIICPPDADAPVVFAASELKCYLGRMLAGEEGDLNLSLEVRPDPMPGPMHTPRW